MTRTKQRRQRPQQRPQRPNGTCCKSRRVLWWQPTTLVIVRVQAWDGRHESCSRQYARTVFDGQIGTPGLLDLQSTHGTTVNRRPLPAAARHAKPYNENDPTVGSRGVILYPFDVLQFGASTRKFCLEGLADYERGTSKMNAKRLAAPALDEQATNL